MKRNESAMPIIDPKRCDGCVLRLRSGQGLCVRLCPSGALVPRDGKAVVVADEPCACEIQCETLCPRGAIQLPFQIVFAKNPHSHR